MSRLILSVALALALAAAVGMVVRAAAIPESTPPREHPTLDQILARAAKAATTFADPTRVIVCEESYQPIRYKDRGSAAMDGVGLNRLMLEAESWTAEFAIAATPTLEHLGFPWWELRHIVTIDGKPQPAEIPGLLRLVTEPAESLLSAFSGMKGRPEASGPGPYERAVMMPRVAALYLLPASQARFKFKDSTRYPDETIRKLTFKAKKKPTLLESPVGLLIMPTSGTMWVDQTTGTVQKAFLRVENFSGRRRNDWMTITYGADGQTGLWLPVSMEHQTEDLSRYETIEGKAEYTNCRAVPRTPR
jgi:hypothetical protein